jgi:hydroxyacylglutathione hydrolase
MSFEIVQIEVGMMLNFSTILASPRTGECAVVDPAFEVDRLMREVERRGWRVSAILVTHTHHDHIDGVEALAVATGAPAYVGAGELEALRRAAPKATLHPIEDGAVLVIGSERLTALATPGHTVDARSYLTGEAIATGDTLFVGGCGRTDFPGGDAATLFASLQRLGALPEEVRVYPGHDYGQTPTSTIGWERTTNPYLRCQTVEEFVALRTGKNAPRPVRGPR